MATVRHLGLFSLPNVALGSVSDFILGRNRCVQPASSFLTTTLSGVAATIAPATLPQSTYTPVSLERAMLWMWKVKNFSITGSLQLIDVENDDREYNISFGPFNMPNLKFNFLSDPIESESEKICDCGMFYVSQQSPDFEDGVAGSWKVTASIGELQNMWRNYPETPEINIGSVGQRVRHNQDSEIFYIPVFVEIFIRGTSSLNSCTSGSTTTSLEGEDKSVYWIITDSLGNSSRAFRFGSDDIFGNINIQATEYWPYDP